MKIYKIEYYGMDDNTYKEFYPSKKEANKRFNTLNKKTHKGTNDEEDGDDNYTSICKQVFDIAEFNVDISKKGILKMLNTHFKEQ